jgi:hypothetical protein
VHGIPLVLAPSLQERASRSKIKKEKNGDRFKVEEEVEEERRVESDKRKETRKEGIER